MNGWKKILLFTAAFFVTAGLMWQLDRAGQTLAAQNVPSSPTLTVTASPLPVKAILDEQKEVQIAPEKENPQQLSVPILMYHHVSPLASDADQITTNLTVDPEKFDAQLAYLQEQGYTTLTLTQLNQVFFGKRQLPQKPIVLTFDDGYADNYDYAFPVLKKYKMNAVFFVITGMRDGWYMSWKQIKELAQSGMEIDSHTVSHPDLAKLSVEAIASELQASKNEIDQQLGIKSLFLSYPAGKFSDTVIEEARRVGYLGAVTTNYGSEVKSQRIFEIPRLRVNRDTTLSGLLQ